MTQHGVTWLNMVEFMVPIQEEDCERNGRILRKTVKQKTFRSRKLTDLKWIEHNKENFYTTKMNIK